MTNFFWARDLPQTCAWLHASEVIAAGGIPSAARPLTHINGVFDLVHASHMRLIATARRGQGKTGGLKTRTLVATMDSDRMVREKKGAGRPILSWVERASCLQYLGVDYLIEIDSDEEYRGVVLALKPDLLVTGGDKVALPNAFPQFLSMVVRDHGMRTSEIVRRCKEKK